MAGLWDTIKDQASPTRDIANDGIVIVEDPPRGAPIRVQRNESLKFRPLDPRAVDAIIAGRATPDTQTVFDVDTVNGQYLRDAIKQLDANNDQEPRAVVTLEKQSELLPSIDDDFSDLIGDLSEPEPAVKLGRPRKFVSDAERQKAYRDRVKINPKLKTKRRKK